MFACFDFEAILGSRENHPMGHATTMVNRHRAIPVALASNVCSSECEHGVEVEACAFCQLFRKAVCFVNADEDQLLTQMLEHLSAIQIVARYYYLHQFQRVFLTLDKISAFSLLNWLRKRMFARKLGMGEMKPWM